jgi:hypothetical protein
VTFDEKGVSGRFLRVPINELAVSAKRFPSGKRTVRGENESDDKLAKPDSPVDPGENVTILWGEYSEVRT